jgi:hypothetical protein
MSTKFFQSIRRNQRQWMVVVTVLSMVSFLFLDDFGKGKGPMSPLGGALLIGCLVGAAMSIIGYPRQKTTEYGVGGLLAGLIAGFIGFSAMNQAKPVVKTALGNYTRQDLDRMAQKRQRTNVYFAAVSRGLDPAQQVGFGGFGGIDDPSLLEHRIMLSDAKRMGIQVSDEGANDFLKKTFNGLLTRQNHRSSLNEAKLGERELLDSLKEELAAQLAMRLMVPPTVEVQVRPEFAQYTQTREPLRYMQQTPHQLWDSFQMMNLKESLQAVAIPVNDFVGEIGQPSDAELTPFFEKFRNDFWTDEARPGFTAKPRVQLAYLTADFEKFEKKINPTEEEVREYYEKNTDRYRAPVMKESTAPKLPDEKTQSDAADALKPEDQKNSKTEENNPAPATDEKKTDDANQKKDDEAGNDKNSAEPKSKCGDDDTAAEQKTATEPAAEKKVEANSEDSKPEPPANPELGATEIALPKLSNSPESLPQPKLRELNDDLKLEIRETIARERAFGIIAAALDQANEFMVPLGLDYDTTIVPGEKTEKVKVIAEKLRNYAAENDLEYKESPEWEYEDLLAQPIGMAFENQRRSPVASDVMMRDEKGESRMPLYSPHRADLRNKRGSFAYWKISDTPAHATDLKDAAVREKAIRAWKFDRARLLAEKRANALAEQAKLAGNNLVAAVSGESSTGQSNDPALTVIETPEFTWLSSPQSVPSAQGDPLITDIPLIPNVNNDFMKVVFEDLKQGEIGVATNSNKSTYYVVKVRDRDSAGNDGGVEQDALRKRFLAERFTGLYPIIKSPYESLAQLPLRTVYLGWQKNFQKRHSVEWEKDPDAPSSRRR